MIDFSKWMKYVVRDDRSLRHVFYRVTDFDINDAKKVLGHEFPPELDMFYKQVGYGFLCCDDNESVDRIMDPLAVVNVILRSDKYDFIKEDYKNKGLLPFFEVGDDLYITISTYTGGIFYFGKKVANSLSEFLDRMDKKTDYYEQVI